MEVAIVIGIIVLIVVFIVSSKVQKGVKAKAKRILALGKITDRNEFEAVCKQLQIDAGDLTSSGRLESKDLWERLQALDREQADLGRIDKDEYQERKKEDSMGFSSGDSQSVDFELIQFSRSSGKGYVVQRTQDKQRLASWGLPQSHLFAFDVAGTSYRKEALQDSAFKPGKRLAVVPEPTNPADPQALAVWDSAQKLHIGYVPADCDPDMKTLVSEEERLTYISMWEKLEGQERVGLRVLVIMPDTRIRLPNK